jgi:raffinose/stachyose/melibiose transport system substrate-binding protein
MQSKEVEHMRTATRPERGFGRFVAGVAAAAVSVLVLTACSGPGGAAPSTGATSGALANGETPTCGTVPVEMRGYFETGYPIYDALTTEFTRQYPNVTWDMRMDQYGTVIQNGARILADNPPDLVRVPEPSSLAQDGLVMDLDPYAEAFGWDEWPESQLSAMRVTPDGSRGSGPLYAMGISYLVAGVFYNKDLASEIGIETPPATIAEFDAALAKAAEAGIVPIGQWNSGANAGLAFTLNALMGSYGPTDEVGDWVFKAPDATIDTESNRSAAQHLEGWIDDGYVVSDANAIDSPTMMSRFISGESLFVFTGDWEAANLDKQMPGSAGFFLMPPADSGGKSTGMTTPWSLSIGAGAENPDCAAFFLNWVATDEAARTIVVEVGGSHPMGPADAFMPSTEAGTVVASTLAAGGEMAANDGGMPFITTATPTIFPDTLSPNLQKLMAGQISGDELIANIQKDYESQTGR